jgi:hypothetical protein
MVVNLWDLEQYIRYPAVSIESSSLFPPKLYGFIWVVNTICGWESMWDV